MVENLPRGGRTPVRPPHVRPCVEEWDSIQWMGQGGGVAQSVEERGWGKVGDSDTIVSFLNLSSNIVASSKA